MDHERIEPIGGPDAGYTWDEHDAVVAASLVRQRARRARAARIMVLLLVVPLAIQGLTVLLGVATVFGLGAVILPAVVVWMVVRGRAGASGRGTG